MTLTFDFQGGEDIRPLASGKMDNEKYTQAEYGPNTAIWRILRILDEEAVKATFLTCGAIAERYPDAVKAIVAAGEIAGPGYHQPRPHARAGKRGHAQDRRHDPHTTRTIKAGAPARRARTVSNC